MFKKVRKLRNWRIQNRILSFDSWKRLRICCQICLKACEISLPVQEPPKHSRNGAILCLKTADFWNSKIRVDFWKWLEIWFQHLVGVPPTSCGLARGRGLIPSAILSPAYQRSIPVGNRIARISTEPVRFGVSGLWRPNPPSNTMCTEGVADSKEKCCRKS